MCLVIKIKHCSLYVDTLIYTNQKVIYQVADLISSSSIIKWSEGVIEVLSSPKSRFYGVSLISIGSILSKYLILDLEANIEININDKYQ